MGLVSPGGVHSHNDHLYGFIAWRLTRGLDKVYMHAFLDGRDTPPQSAQTTWRAGDADGQDRRRTSGHCSGPLLRHGPGQKLGARGKGMPGHGARRGRVGRAKRHAGGGKFLCPTGHTMNSSGPRLYLPRRSAARHSAAGRQRDLLQLPPRPCPPDHARLSSIADFTGFQRARRLHPAAVRLHDAAMTRHIQ